MFFWLLAALLTLAASLAVMKPFLRKADKDAAAGEHDIAVYRDQLRELDEEVRRGLISESDAAEARAEIGRKILRLTKAQEKSGAAPQHAKLAGAIAMAAVLAVPVVSWGLYAMLGSPGLPTLPLQARLQQDPSGASLDELIARTEAHLADNPEDARGWEVLAPVYARLGRYGDAIAAYRRTIALAGATADREAGLGEAMVGQSGGVVTADAEAAFRRAMDLDKANSRARFYTAMARAQEGRHEEARAIWQEMSESLPDDSPWKGVAGQALANLAAAQQQRAGAGAAGPSQEDIAAAGNMEPEARQEMIEGMVASLDAKLRDNPADPEGWRRLLRSYVVLGRRGEAADALGRALAALGAESAEGQALTEFAGTLGITAVR
ncbi:c-type cytochrome biogenesis protein CcmI [Chelativorans sp.]|uniref:c-type cytochrome biogenesis protein CcmI n=1 Tax=Chelativorans sp. TaxID=2203393 RepID=UPI0028113564|nr:c-type cytochrome biogenesis protein CcmI [Chelativorans sp.]